MAFHDESNKGMSKVQKLYDACHKIFSSGRKTSLPTIRQIRRLQEILDTMEPGDVGIDAFSDDERSTDGENGFFLGKAAKQITYIHIHECDDFSMGIFCMPAGARFPLHDHPKMAVLSKLLYGSLRLTSYDWVTAPSSSPNKTGLAKVVADKKLLEAPCKSTVLFPRSGGNIHSFYAETPCAILDVIAPPYSDELGRPSTYYSDIPVPTLPGFVILDEIDLPDDLRVHGAPYAGPELSVDMEFC